MIGTGVFTSLGFQLIEIQSAPVIMMLWLVGGLSALCGALSYAELGAALPRSGGEYHFLTEIYHPCAGFISGWVSATVGFAAPTALAALTFGSYLNSSGVAVNPLWLATVAIVALTAAHCSTHRHSGGTQTGFTVLKLLLIVAFSFAALTLSPSQQPISLAWDQEASILMGSGAFAVSLIYVNYAYSGWNAATYISGELENPQLSLPRVLGISTAVVAALYCLLNFVFLSVAPMEAMAGKVEVGVIAAEFAFGSTLGTFMGLLLALLLISTISAMILAGPRVLHRIGQDYPRFAASRARESRWHSGQRYSAAVRHGFSLSLDSLFRADSGVLGCNHGSQHFCHGAGAVRAALDTAHDGPPVQGLALSSHANDLFGDYRLDAGLCRDAAAIRGSDLGGHRAQRRRVLCRRAAKSRHSLITRPDSRNYPNKNKQFHGRTVAVSERRRRSG